MIEYIVARLQHNEKPVNTQPSSSVILLISKTVELVKDVAVATANYTKKTTEAAAASVQMAKEAQRAELLNIGILEESDRRAEEQRQIRDEERNTITERIEANEKLKVILEKQNKDMLENAKIVERQAIAAFELNGGIEQELALIAAKNEVKAVEATIAGFISEQKANDLALTREKQELDATINDGEILRRQEEREWNAEGNQGELM